MVIKIFFFDQVKVLFIQNKVKVKGVVVYILILSVCLWYEEYLFYSVYMVICWNNMFEYCGNFIYFVKIFKLLQGLEYDIVIDIYYFEYEGNNYVELMVGYFFFLINFFWVVLD